MAKYRKHIIVVGSARSGTSWLSETISKQFRYRMLFEPEHDSRTKKGHLLCDRYLLSAEGNEAVISYLHQLFKNKVDSDWIAQNSNRKLKMHLWPWIPKKYVIKFVRCNLSAAWMHHYFEIPVIHIIRNPYDVILSQQRVKFPWLYDLSRFQSQPHLVALVQKEFGVDILQAESYSGMEVLALRWCLENVVPLQCVRNTAKDYAVVKYEDLRINVNNYLKLCAQFNIEPIANIEEVYKKPSSKTHPKSAILDPNENLLSFNETELAKVNRVLMQFKQSFYPLQSEA